LGLITRFWDPEGLYPTLKDWSREQFAFLADHGFVVNQVTQHSIQWRKGDRTIVLSRDWRDGYTYLDFAYGTGPSDYRMAFGLYEALQVAAPDAWPSHYWKGRRQSTARKNIAEIAALVSAHLGAFLSNGAELWHQAEDLTRARSRADTTEVVAYPIRRQADTAWQTQDWPAVIDRYEKLQAMGAVLKQSEIERLQYAREQS
jgi:hypothetical protein